MSNDRRRGEVVFVVAKSEILTTNQKGAMDPVTMLFIWVGAFLLARVRFHGPEPCFRLCGSKTIIKFCGIAPVKNWIGLRMTFGLGEPWPVSADQKQGSAYIISYYFSDRQYRIIHTR